MRLSELLEMVNDLANARDDDPEVFVAQQPSWPLAGRLRGLCDPREWLDETDVELGATDPRRRADVVWLVSGEASDYAPREAFDAV